MRKFSYTKYVFMHNDKFCRRVTSLIRFFYLNGEPFSNYLFIYITWTVSNGWPNHHHFNNATNDFHLDFDPRERRVICDLLDIKTTQHRNVHTYIHTSNLKKHNTRMIRQNKMKILYKRLYKLGQYNEHVIYFIWICSNFIITTVDNTYVFR